MTCACVNVHTFISNCFMVSWLLAGTEEWTGKVSAMEDMEDTVDVQYVLKASRKYSTCAYTTHHNF